MKQTSLLILDEKLTQLEKKFEEMRSVVFHNCVTWMELSEISVGETVTIENTINHKLHEGEHCQIFRTIIPPKVHFPNHWHDFLEQNLMLFGELSCNGKIYYKGEWMIFNPLESHHIFNETDKDAIIIVIFTK